VLNVRTQLRKICRSLRELQSLKLQSSFTVDDELNNPKTDIIQ